MRILFCNYEYPPLGGGGGVVNELLAEELATRHDVSVLTSQALDLPEKEERNGVSIMRLPVYFRRQYATANMPSMLAFLLQGLSTRPVFFGSKKFDVINTHFALPSGPVGHHLAKALNIPNVLSLHGGDLYDPSKFSSPHRHPLLRGWIRRLSEQADAVVTQSTNTLNNAREYYDLSRTISTIPLGIRRPPESTANRQRLGLADDDFVMVSVGRLVARKATDQLIQMLARMNNPRAKLVLIGGGKLEEELKSLCRELGVSEQVMFAGHVSEEKKQALLQSSDIFVSTSQHEGFGIVFLEAMAAGLPVVCYDFGGQTDFLEQEQTGNLIALNDQGAFLSACERLSQDTDTRQKMGQHNLQKVEAYFIDSCARAYEEVFSAVTQSDSASRVLSRN